MAGIGNIAEMATKVLVDKRTAALKGEGKSEEDIKKALKGLRFTSEDVALIFDQIIDLTVNKREVVSIQGFGNFRLMDRKATKARNPQTGAQFDVPASHRLKMTPSKTLRELIGSKKDSIPPVQKRAAKPAAAPKAATPAPAPAAVPAPAAAPAAHAHKTA